MSDSESDIAGKWSEALVPFLEQNTPFSPPAFAQVEDAQEQFDILAEQKVLVVGAGALGCEALKCLAMSGYADITIVDMDTIELSNLNRQFMFRSKDIGRYKAEVAAEFITKQRPHIKTAFELKKIQSYGALWMRRFQLVVLCLDNDEARQWINEALIDMVEFKPYTQGKNALISNITMITTPPSLPPGMFPPGFEPPLPKPSDWYRTTSPLLFNVNQYSQYFQNPTIQSFQFSDSFQHLLLQQLVKLYPLSSTDSTSDQTESTSISSSISTYQLPTIAQEPIIISLPVAKNVNTVVPYCEGGTEGWQGHYRMLRPHTTYCLGCTRQANRPKENLHTHLCTIANVPRIPEHCIMYAHQLLWPKLISLTSRTVYQMTGREPNSPLQSTASSPLPTPIDNTVSIDVSSDPHGVEFDADIMDHVYWCLDRAVERANQFNITPPTYAQTLGVIKGTIPAISSTNSLIASLCVNAAFQFSTCTNIPFSTNDNQNPGQKCDGVHVSFTSDNYNTSVGIVTNEINKKKDCVVCSPRYRINCSPETPLIFPLLSLIGQAWYGSDFKQCYEAIAIELIDVYQDHPALQTIALVRTGNAFNQTAVSSLVTALFKPIGSTMKERRLYRLDDLTKTNIAIKFDVQFFKP